MDERRVGAASLPARPLGSGWIPTSGGAGFRSFNSLRERNVEGRVRGLQQIKGGKNSYGLEIS